MASPNTDVFVLLVNHFSCMGLCEIVFNTGRKVYPCTKKWCRLPLPTDYGYENDTETGNNLPKIVSQPLAPPKIAE